MAPDAKGLPHCALGMVLGARELVCDAGHFAAGSTLTITIERLMQDERFGSFECTIHADSVSLATGRVNTFQPSEEELTTLFNRGNTIMRSVLVTGASKGIGRAIALQLAADGFTVGVHYHRDEAGAQETLEAIVRGRRRGPFTHLRRGQPRAVPHGAGTGDR